VDCPSVNRPLAAFSLSCALALSGCADDVALTTETSTTSDTSSTGNTPTTNTPTSNTPTSDPSTGTPTTGTTDNTGTSSTGGVTDSTTSSTTTGLDTGTTDDSSTGDTDPPPPVDPLIVCDTPPLVPPAEGTCEISKPGTQGLIIRGTVLGPDTVYENGAVVVHNGIISCVGCDCLDQPEFADATELSCADGVISPGLINPHDHISFAKNKPIGEGVDRYEHRHDWRKGKNGHQALNVPGNASTDAILAAELRFIMSGATSAASAGGKAGLLRNLDTSNMLEGLPIQLANSDTFPLGDSNGTQIENGCAYDPARSSPPRSTSSRPTSRTSPRASTASPATSLSA
jgi:hypothetical protein